MKNQKRWLKLNSVGCCLDTSTGYTYPITSTGGMINSPRVSIYDCSDEWYQSLDSYDWEIVKEYKHNNSDLRYTTISSK